MRGMSGSPDLQTLQSCLARMITADPTAAFGIPGGVLAVCGPSGEPAVVAQGVDARGAPIHVDSLFPIGSASKLAVGLLLLRLMDQGRLRPDTPLSEMVPEAAASKFGITIGQLMSHTSGMPLEVLHDLSTPPGNLRYTDGLKWPGRLAEACLAAVPAEAPGTSVRYSNLAYGLLGVVAERLLGAPFGLSLRQEIFAPLKMEGWVGTIPERHVIQVLDVPSPFAGSNIEPINSPLWLSMGAPWSGVTTSATGLLALVCAYRDNSAILTTETARLARSDQTDGLAGGYPSTEPFIGHNPSRSIVWNPCPWGLAIEIQGGKRPHWGPTKLPRSYGQIGSSGCFAWCDPDSGIAWAFMGARSTESGWLLLHGPRVAQAALTAVEKGRVS